MHNFHSNPAWGVRGILSRILSLIVLSLTLSSAAIAQNAYVDKFHVTKKLTAVQNKEKDSNGQYCALLLVTVRRSDAEGVADSTVKFSSHCIKSEYKGPEYWVYLPTDQTSFSLRSDYLPETTINISDSIPNGLEQLKTYELEISIAAKNNSAQGVAQKKFLHLQVTPAEATVYVDNQKKNLPNGWASIPLHKGDHHIRIECDGYKSHQEVIKMVNSDIPKDIFLIREKDNQVELFEGQDGRKGFRDSKKRVIVKPIYDKVFNAGTKYWVKKDGMFGMLNEFGYEIIPLKYTNVQKANQNGVYIVKNTKGEMGIVTNKGEESVKCELENVSPTSSSAIIIVRDGLYGLVDENGNPLVECIYNEISNFSNGVAIISRDGKYGYINEEGEEIIAPIYESASGFAAGQARVFLNGESYYIDKKGNRLY